MLATYLDETATPKDVVIGKVIIVYSVTVSNSYYEPKNKYQRL